MLPLDVAATVYVEDVDAPLLLVDAVDDAVAASPRRAQAGERAAQRAAETVGRFGEGAKDQLHAGSADLLRQPQQVVLRAG